MHISYEEILHHPPDFRVKYRFLTQDEGGRQHLPIQGYRSDFRFSNVEGKFMIFPEFEDEHGNLILEKDKPVPASGTARMWVAIPERRVFHASHVHVGQKAFFVEGPGHVAECEVLEVIALADL